MRDLRGALRFTSRMQWRNWLQRNHAAKREALLVIYKRAPKNEKFPSLAALELPDKKFRPKCDLKAIWEVSATATFPGEDWPRLQTQMAFTSMVGRVGFEPTITRARDRYLWPRAL